MFKIKRHPTWRSLNVDSSAHYHSYIRLLSAVHTVRVWKKTSIINYCNDHNAIKFHVLLWITYFKFCEHSSQCTCNIKLWISVVLKNMNRASSNQQIFFCHTCIYPLLLAFCAAQLYITLLWCLSFYSIPMSNKSLSHFLCPLILWLPWFRSPRPLLSPRTSSPSHPLSLPPVPCLPASLSP